MTLESLRSRVSAQLDPLAKSSGLSLANRILAVLILLAVVIAVAETEPALVNHWRGPFAVMELVLGVAFAVEYGLRIWISPDRSPDQNPWLTRVRFVLSPAGLADLVAIVASFVTVAGSSALLLRLVRLFRLLRLAKLVT